eukprot:TRINITY_DN697_c0_g1_i1.p1 TRINITY_DN697_c0_g1~~TRINITY_DN697_c0_g1_i1.p1  ORF type:complete len:480 (-),score=88.85 TRINITY_DN697_c0_g1_i1:198-1637(-)
MLRVQNALCSENRLEVDRSVSSTCNAYEKGPDTLSHLQDLPYEMNIQNTFINIDDGPGSPVALQRFQTWPIGVNHCQPELQLPAKARLDCFAATDDREQLPATAYLDCFAATDVREQLPAADHRGCFATADDYEPPSPPVMAQLSTAAQCECFAAADDCEPPLPPVMAMYDMPFCSEELQPPAIATLERWKSWNTDDGFCCAEPLPPAMTSLDRWKSWKTDDPFEADVLPLPETGITVPGISLCQLDLHPPASVPFGFVATVDLAAPGQSTCGMPEHSSLSVAPIVHVPALVLFQPVSFDLTQPGDAEMPAPAPNVEQSLVQAPPGDCLRPTPGLQAVYCEASGTLRSVHWTVDARLLTSSDREKASDSFDVSFGVRAVKFRIFLRASKVKDQRGGSCFRKAKGKGEVVLTCVDERSPPPGDLIYNIFVGSAALRMRHDFFEKKAASDHEQFSFRDAEDKASQTFTVHLELIAAPPAVS